MKERIGKWLREEKERLLILVGIVLVGILCFEAGLLQGSVAQESPLVLTLPPIPESTSQQGNTEAAKPSIDMASLEPVMAKNENRECAFVGSKNSNKYHLPSCAAAKRIKPENRVCFASKEDAEEHGYVPSCLK